jgi:hypothetical protein
MVTIEMIIAKRGDLKIGVTAYCTDNTTKVAEAIRYKIYKWQNGQELFNDFIDATTPHFAKEDMEDVWERVRRAAGTYS